MFVVNPKSSPNAVVPEDLLASGASIQVKPRPVGSSVLTPTNERTIGGWKKQQTNMASFIMMEAPMICSSSDSSVTHDNQNGVVDDRRACKVGKLEDEGTTTLSVRCDALFAM
jgi:hypothetical protein